MAPAASIRRDGRHYRTSSPRQPERARLLADRRSTIRAKARLRDATGLGTRLTSDSAASSTTSSWTSTTCVGGCLGRSGRTAPRRATTTATASSCISPIGGTNRDGSGAETAEFGFEDNVNPATAAARQTTHSIRARTSTATAYARRTYGINPWPNQTSSRWTSADVAHWDNVNGRRVQHETPRRSRACEPAALLPSRAQDRKRGPLRVLCRRRARARRRLATMFPLRG